MDNVDLLKQLTLHTGVSGYEENIALFVKEVFEKYCDKVEIDRYFNVIGFKKGHGHNNKKIMITAHLDEVALIVTSIDDKGFIRISGVNGIDPKVLLGQEIIIHGTKDMYGIIGAKPPHLLKPEERKKAIKMKDLVIDTGLEVDKVKECVSVGDMVTFKAQLLSLEKGRISSKTLDNRCGVAVLVETMKEISLLKHQSDIYFIATVQEESSMVGAISAAYNIEPDLSVVIDACHGDMPGIPQETSYTLGKGPAIALGPDMHKKATRKLMDTAKLENIAYQVEVITGKSGTEASVTQVSRKGIPAVLISVPVRYMHTAVETVDSEDIRNAGRLTTRFIMSIEEEMEAVLCF